MRDLLLFVLWLLSFVVAMGVGAGYYLSIILKRGSFMHENIKYRIVKESGEGN